MITECSTTQKLDFLRDRQYYILQQRCLTDTVTNQLGQLLVFSHLFFYTDNTQQTCRPRDRNVHSGLIWIRYEPEISDDQRSPPQALEADKCVTDYLRGRMGTSPFTISAIFLGGCARSARTAPSIQQYESGVDLFTNSKGKPRIHWTYLVIIEFSLYSFICIK